MIDLETAKSLVNNYLSTLPEKDGSVWAIDGDVMEFDLAWMFCWTLERLIIVGDERPGMVGNRPIVVDKRDGSLYGWSMLEPIERFLEKLRDKKLTLLPLTSNDGSC